MPLDTEGLADQYLALAERLRPLVADASELINDALDAGRSVMFEGAQGTMLDIDFGTYPLRHFVERDFRRRLHGTRRGPHAHQRAWLE